MENLSKLKQGPSQFLSMTSLTVCEFEMLLDSFEPHCTKYFYYHTPRWRRFVICATTYPLADLISLPFHNNLNMNYGEYNRNMNILNIQPVIPLFGGKLITRIILPIVRIPDFNSESGKLYSGLSDIVFTAFYVPESKGLMWGFRPVFELPTGGSIRGTEKWSAGPSMVVLSQTPEWTFGGLINNAWSFAGDSDRDDVNHMMINLFAVRQLG